MMVPKQLANTIEFMLERSTPAIGAVVSGNAQAYSYLPESVARFPAPHELAELMDRTAFDEVAFESWTAGIVTLHKGRARV